MKINAGYGQNSLKYSADQNAQLAQAIAQTETALQAEPNNIQVLNQLAMLRASAGQTEQAFEHISQALKLAPVHPLLHYNCGQILGAMNRHEQEIEAYQQAVRLKPDFVEAFINMGVALRDCKEFTAAAEAFKQALRLNPDHPGARTNRAQTNLMLGNYEHGWREYEWRWQDGKQRHDVPGPGWNGKVSLKGKRLLVHAEQGLGDTVQFVRYIDLLGALGATIYLRVQPVLVTLLADYPGVALVLSDQETLPEHDFHIPLLSLPYALFARHPEIPSCAQYLKADASRLQIWKDRLARYATSDTPANNVKHSTSPYCAKLKVGLCWSGSQQHLNDQNRSILLSQWSPILEHDCLFVSLQKNVRTEDLQTLHNHPDILNADVMLDDFADTAALISNLDLVICVDTSVAHLSGALGKETWILLPEPADWRWQLTRSDTPWYPLTKLFRQQQRGDWTSVISTVSSQLQARVDTHRAQIPRNGL